MIQKAMYSDMPNLPRLPFLPRLPNLQHLPTAAQSPFSIHFPHPQLNKYENPKVFSFCLFLSEDFVKEIIQLNQNTNLQCSHGHRKSPK